MRGVARKGVGGFNEPEVVVVQRGSPELPWPVIF